MDNLPIVALRSVLDTVETKLSMLEDDSYRFTRACLRARNVGHGAEVDLIVDDVESVEDDHYTTIPLLESAYDVETAELISLAGEPEPENAGDTDSAQSAMFGSDHSGASVTVSFKINPSDIASHIFGRQV